MTLLNIKSYVSWLTIVAKLMLPHSEENLGGSNRLTVFIVDYKFMIRIWRLFHAVVLARIRA